MFGATHLTAGLSSATALSTCRLQLSCLWEEGSLCGTGQIAFLSAPLFPRLLDEGADTRMGSELCLQLGSTLKAACQP